MSTLVLFLLLVSILLIFISLIVKLIHKKNKNIYFNYDGKIIYEDLYEVNQKMKSNILALCGKPDYILQKKRKLHIPVEVKTGIHTKPRKHHIIQLLAYCQLVEESYQHKVPYGLLIYHDTKCRFKIPFNHKNRKLLISIIETMKTQIKKGTILRNHKSINKCISCSMNEYCTQKLE